jgi:hypothetical protein
MSKKNKHRQVQAVASASHNSGLSHAGEYRIIKFDLIKVVILNVVYLAVILGLYFANRQSGFLDNWFAKVLHF